MTTAPETGLVLEARDVSKTFARDKLKVRALDQVSIKIHRGTLAAVVGPDGAGKTTLLRLVAGLLHADEGSIAVLNLNMPQQAQAIQERIGYMPQRFGLYEDLSVQENLDLYADLHGVTVEERRERYPQLMSMTALGAFTDRLAGKLSGGMKQKLGLACTLVRSPELLLLDEPTVGVDPLSRRELWDIIRQLVQEQQLTVLMSTAYLDEAEQCAHAIVLHEGQVLAQGAPQSIADLARNRTYVAEPRAGNTARALQAQLMDHGEVIDAVPDGGRVRCVLRAPRADGGPTPALLPDVALKPVEPRFEDGFMVLLRQKVQADPASTIKLDRSVAAQPDTAVVQVRDLVRRFGTFTAVDHINFEVHRGEIFGLLGPNGAGKTTTFRMLCGLLPASGGTLLVAGADLRRAAAEARQNVGYVAQKFALYAALSVRENLEFFASAYGLRGKRREDRIRWSLQQFELEDLANSTSGELPGGYKQRLAMSAALLHEPEILFLDEPTSGADPIARRAFWRRITALAEQGVTVIVTTHFMQEAEYCDRVAILDAGRILAQGTPRELRNIAKASTTDARALHEATVHEPTMEDAFIAIVSRARDRQRDEAAA